MSELFSLCWDNFHKNMSSGMQSLLDNEHLVDVTLAVEGRHLKAHKMVLSVCSPYFRELFRTTPCTHPVVFLKDVSYVALSDLLQFMYQGEVQVAQENLTTFIKTAEALQIKGLTGDGSHDSEEPETTEVIENPVVESSNKRIYDSTPKLAPTNKARKLGGPASKRPKFSIPSTAPTSTPNAASTTSDTPVSPTTEMIHFKMEPQNANQLHTELIDESHGEPFDDTNAEDGPDDTEDTLMETTTEEAKAGTSADVAGEGQGRIYFIQGQKHPKLLLNGYDFDCERRKSGKTFWRCAQAARMKCRARLLTAGGSLHIHNDNHNHDVREKLQNLSEDQVAALSVTIIRSRKCRPNT